MSLSIPSEYISTGVGTGSDVVIEGDFSNGGAAWVVAGESTVNTGVGRILSTAGAFSTIAQVGILTIGQAYLVSYDVISATGSMTNNSGSKTWPTTVGAVSTVYTADFVNLTFKRSGVCDISIDNVSVKRIDHGQNVDGVRCYPWLNGNTVVDNVVSEAQGALIDPDTIKGTLMGGAATELTGRSNDAASWPIVNTATAVKDAVGLTGAPNTAETCTDNSAVATQFFQDNETVADDSLPHFVMARIKYNASPSVYSWVRMDLSGGTTGRIQALVFDPSDGSYVETNTNGTVHFVVREGDYWFILQSLANNTTGNTILASRFTPAYNSDGTITADVTAQGSTILGAFELYKTNWSYSPILTTGGTTKTRLSDAGYTLAGANWSAAVDEHGAVRITPTPYFDAASGANQGVITPNDTTANKLLVWSGTTAKRLVLLDGTSFPFVDGTYSLGDSILTKASWGAGAMNLSVDGVAGVEDAYDGSFEPTGDITIGKSLSGECSFKDIELFNVKVGL